MSQKRLTSTRSFYFRHKLYITHRSLPVHDLLPERNLISDIIIYQPIHTIQARLLLFSRRSIHSSFVYSPFLPFFNFVREWQPGVSFEFHTSIGQNHTPKVFLCRISPPSLHRSVPPLPLCSNTDFLFLCTWIIHTLFIRQVRSDGGFRKVKRLCG